MQHRLGTLAGRFAVRMFVTLLVTIAVVATVQYQVAARALRQRVIAEEKTTHQADATVLASLHASAPATDPWDPVRELLGHIATRPGVRRVRVVGPDSVVTAVGGAHGGGHGGDQPPGGGDHGHAMDARAESPEVDRVLASGRATVEVHTGRDGDDTLVVVPVDLATGRHALEIVKSNAGFTESLADLRVLLLLTLGLGLSLAAPVFYLVGGRTLSARHQAAVDSSTRDALTGLRNHRTYQDTLVRAIDDAHRHATPLSLAIIDLDDFKTVNDSRGHRAGDRVLTRVAGILESGRPGDTAFRVGGDEFAVVMPMTDAAGAAASAERLRRAVTAAGLGVTASVGVASLRPGMAGAAELVDAADAAVYRAKRHGRDRVAVDGRPDGSSPV